jgi:ubiquinone/menaquinone biosynthesis C-methylase UbiE
MPKKRAAVQFDKQAEKFSNWSVTRNLQYMQAYFNFCRMVPEDDLLDVASGTGEFSLFCASRVRSVTGVDISEGMIGIAKLQAAKANLVNVHPICHDVEDLPLPSDAFSVVICTSTFHHLEHPETVFGEMIRCCKRGGRISVQDIVSYEDEKVNDFFERMEREIDASHHRTSSRELLIRLYKDHQIPISGTYGLEIELNFQEYLNHADQSDRNKKNLVRLLDHGLQDEQISGYFTRREGRLFFRRNVFLILGEKAPLNLGAASR